MDKKTEHTILAVGIAVLAADFAWRWWRHRKLAQVGTPLQQDIADNGGIPNTQQVVAANSPAAPFNSSISVQVNPDIAQYMSNHYMPLFGFVGMQTARLGGAATF